MGLPIQYYMLVLEGLKSYLIVSGLLCFGAEMQAIAVLLLGAVAQVTAVRMELNANVSTPHRECRTPQLRQLEVCKLIGC